MAKEDTQFKPGADWRGNAGGRPKNPLKEFQREVFASMTDEEKKDFLKDITKEVRWKMAEGNPDSTTDIMSDGRPIGNLTAAEMKLAEEYNKKLNELEDGTTKNETEND